MITSSPLGDLLVWVLFWVILLSALWRGGKDLLAYLKHDAEEHEGLQNFPREGLGEPGPDQPAVGGAKKPRARRRRRPGRPPVGSP